MGQEFLNAYIENMTREMGELLKMKILLQTQLELQQKITADLQEKLDKLEKAASKNNKKKDDTF